MFKTIGTDSEVIILNKEGSPVSAENLIKGTKTDPHEVENTGIKTHNDNVLYY